MQAAVEAHAMQALPAMQQHVQHGTDEHCAACRRRMRDALAQSSTLQLYQGGIAAAVDKHSHGDSVLCTQQSWPALTVVSVAGH